MVDYIKLLFSLRLHRQINLSWKPNLQMMIMLLLCPFLYSQES